MPVRLIHDGLTVDFTLSECNEHDELNGSYRPATEGEYSRYTRRIKAAERKPLQAKERVDPVAKITAEFIADHLVSWDVENGDGQLADITLDNCLKLPASITVEILEKVVTSSRDGTLSEQMGN